MPAWWRAGRGTRSARRRPAGAWGQEYDAHTYGERRYVAGLRVAFHPSTLQRAVLNVLQNAIEAMTETLTEELGMRPLQAHCHHGLGTLYAATGQQEQACIALSTAINLYRAMEMAFWLPETEAILAQVDTR